MWQNKWKCILINIFNWIIIFDNKPSEPPGTITCIKWPGLVTPAVGVLVARSQCPPMLVVVVVLPSHDIFPSRVTDVPAATFPSHVTPPTTLYYTLHNTVHYITLYNIYTVHCTHPFQHVKLSNVDTDTHFVDSLSSL